MNQTSQTRDLRASCGSQGHYLRPKQLSWTSKNSPINAVK